MKLTDSEIQRRYYSETAESYNQTHVEGKDEHFFALSFLLGVLDYLDIKTILDVGAGTGRAVLHVKELRPDIRIVGIEPVQELREIGYQSGLTQEDLVAGNALDLNYTDGKFDLVCEFGVLHHIKEPEVAVAEMLRVAGKAIFLSDSNNFGQGSPLKRFIKQNLNRLGLWPAFDWIKTKGKGYTITEGDGLAYSYSVFQNYAQIRNNCSVVHLLNTCNATADLYKTAGHLALLGVKETANDRADEKPRGDNA